MDAQLQPQNTPTPKVDYTDPSVWGRLNDIYKAKIRLCDRDGNLLNDGKQVVAVALDGQMSSESNWATPFESSNPENKMPTLLGGLQSGTMTDFISAAEGAVKEFTGVDFAGVLGLNGSFADKVEQAEGRSSFTKVNSTQIYLSSSSVQITMTLVFRAWRNAKKEVENQVGLLQQMSAAQELSKDGIASNVMKGEGLGSFMPSLIPPYLAMYYGNKCYAPMILQSFSRDIVGNMTGHGDMVYLEVPITLMSRQAWDARDVAKLYNMPGLK